MRKTHGFTLIELMIVVAIIAIIAAIAIPNLMRSKLQSNEAAAISNLNAIAAAQVTYNGANDAYTGSFDDLTGATPPFLDGDWSGVKQGYTFVMAGGGDDFQCNAEPSAYGKTGNRSFFVDSTAKIRWADPGPASAASTPIGETAAAP